MRVIIQSITFMLMSFFLIPAQADTTCCLAPNKALTVYSLPKCAIAEQLGWISSTENHCGGFYLDKPFLHPENFTNTKHLMITSDQGLFSFRGTSTSEGKITITYAGQQITANRAYIYRDPKTGKLSSIDLLDDVILRDQNDFVVANHGHYDIREHSKSLFDILYRVPVYSTNKQSIKNTAPTVAELKQEHKITHLSAWGQAHSFSQTEPKIYDLENVTYSTCPPTTSCAWQIKASKIQLNKNTGRGTAKNARLLIKRIPVLYTPYFNFPIDSRRQTGFLPPSFGVGTRTGFAAPFYWNLAPNYDTTITPAFLKDTGLQVTDLFRYLTPHSFGHIKASIAPDDKAFRAFQEVQLAENQNSTDPFTQANLRLLENASTTRGDFSWQNNTRFNQNWTSNIDFNYVSDDYYLRDFGGSTNEVTLNQLMQKADVLYQGKNWNFAGRLQQYQTLHPVDDSQTYQNQYSRFPQFILDGEYPDQAGGLDYAVKNELVRFDIRNTPGSDNKLPIGDRMNVQPGISLPFNAPYFYFNPRLQFAMTRYDLGDVTNNNQKLINRALPIFDISSGVFLDRDVSVFHHDFQQTLEPKFYYTFVPYRNQNRIPIFDTTLNTLTYDQLFTYNRFTSIDRIGDANQIALGVTTRLIDRQNGAEKLTAGIGQIIYFRPRLVTLCSTPDCSNVPYFSDIGTTDVPSNPNNTSRQSPLSAVLNYYVNPNWSLTGNTIWGVDPSQLNNQTLTLQYKPDVKRVINLGYSFVRNGDYTQGDTVGSNTTNLSQTDLSFGWPITADWSTLGRWTQNWNHEHFQNLLYGLQYDSCCWAVRFVGGRTFMHLAANQTPQYNGTFYIQFALKGLGTGGGDPSNVLRNSIPGYQTNFGQDV